MLVSGRWFCVSHLCVVVAHIGEAFEARIGSQIIQILVPAQMAVGIESSVDRAVEPFKRRVTLIQHGVSAGDVISRSWLVISKLQALFKCLMALGVFARIVKRVTEIEPATTAVGLVFTKDLIKPDRRRPTLLRVVRVALNYRVRPVS